MSIQAKRTLPPAHNWEAMSKENRIKYREAQGIVQVALQEHRDLTDDEAQRFDRILTDLQKPEPRTVPPEDPSPRPSDEMFLTQDGQEIRALTPEQRLVEHVIARRGGAPTERLSLGRMIVAYTTGDFADLTDTERRALAEGTGATGGFFVPEILSALVIDLARAKAKCLIAGARTIPMDSAKLSLVKVTGDPTAYWTAENAEITSSDPTFGQIDLEAQKLAARVVISRELVEDAKGAAETVERQLLASLANALDAVALVGTGVGAPRGIFYTEGVGEVSMGDNGAAPTSYDEFSQAIQAVLEANETPNGIIMAPRTWGTLDRLKEGTTNAPLTPPASYADLAKHITNQVPTDQTQGTSTTASCSFIGDWPQLMFGIRTQGIAIEVSREAGDAFKQHQLEIKAVLRADLAVLRPAAFCIVKGITE